MLNLTTKNMQISTDEFNKILPVFTYSIATFFLMDFAFFITDIVDTLHFTYLESFILLGIPFIGRMATPFIYSSAGRMGVARLALLSITIMAIISLAMAFETLFVELFVSRFVIGILFGLATSSAIEVSSTTQNRNIIGLTMGGWALGWLLGAIFFMALGSWELVSLAGIIFVPAVIFSKKHNVISPILKKFHFDFSLKVFVVFLLGFTPAYVLEIIPSYIGAASFEESTIAYTLAIFAYLAIPYFVTHYSLKKVIYPSLVIVSASALLFFGTGNLAFAIIFTVFGLGLNSILPVISRNLNVEASKIGPSMNFSAVAGFIYPVILTLGDEAFNAEIAITLSAIFMIVFIAMEFNKKHYGIKKAKGTYYGH
ncbi:MAG: MFS transporter [Ferroplasma sp.]